MSRTIISAVLMALFLYTGSSKLFDLADFTGAMYNQPISRWMAALLIWLLPTAEIITAMCLLFEPTRRFGFYCSLCLLSGFTLYVGAVLLHLFPSVPCSCGSVFRLLSWPQHLWLNLLLLSITALALLPVKRSIPSPLNPS